jgi:hypothetical protein
MRKSLLTAVVGAAVLLMGLLWHDAAWAERRVALIIGNSKYQNVTALPNPVRDARAMTEKFKAAGFDVVSAHYDLGRLEFTRVLQQFEDDATDADIAVIFFAGHGIESQGSNFMIPVDARLVSDRHIEDEAISLDRMAKSVDGARRLRMVILDACRDNPLVRQMKRQRTVTSRAVTSGLAPIQIQGSDTLIAYAAKAGAVAEDGVTDHSPFTQALLDNLFEPGLDLRLAFGRVRDQVMKNTRNRQEPFVYGSLGGTNVSLVPAVEKKVAAASDRSASQDFDFALRVGSRRAMEIFIAQYPSGFLSDLARDAMRKIDESRPGGRDAPIKPDEPERARVAAVEPNRTTSPGPTTQEQRDWDRIKDSSNPALYRDFIKRYPSSVLSQTAQSKLEAIERAARERAAEDARLKAEKEAARKKEEDERRARAVAEAERQKIEREAKAAEEARLKAEKEAARKKEEDERRARILAEIERQRIEREAKAAEEARLRVEREVARKKEEDERRARVAAEAERQRQEREAIARRLEEERIAKLNEADRVKAEKEMERRRADEEQRARAAAEAERQRVEREAKLAEEARVRAEREAARKQAEEEQRARAAAEAERWKQQAELVRVAQQELSRLGCFGGTPDGALGPMTLGALKQYRTRRGSAEQDANVTQDLVDDLKAQSERVCPLTCPSGQAVEGERCVVIAKRPPAQAPETSEPPQRSRQEENRRQRAKQQDEERPRQRAKQQEEEKPRQRQQQQRSREAERPQPRVRQEARSPRQSGGGGMAIGVGF